MTNLSHVHNDLYLGAARKLIDPNRAILAASTPFVIGGGIGPVDHRILIAAAQAAHFIEADYIHLEFAAGIGGPVNVAVAMIRQGFCHIRPNCRFWLDERDQPFLVAKAAEGFATMSFAPEGMDSQPGAPTTDLEVGYIRAAKRLQKLAESTPPANQNDIVQVVVAA